MTLTILRKNMIFSMVLSIPCIVTAQELDDTTAVNILDEVVVHAPKVIRHADMDVYYPSKGAVETSKNGIQILSNLMIPSLNVNDALNTIQVSGQSVQLRINGRVSTIEQVRALLPQTIKRVEWIDNPGLQYGGAVYVINLIVANPTVGGSMIAQARQALNQAWGLYMVDTKFNTGHSQWEIGGDYKLTDKLKSHREYTETFTYPDGRTLTRDETSRGGTISNSMANVSASYNYIKPDTTVFMVQLDLQSNINDKLTYNGLLSLSNGTDEIKLTDVSGKQGNTPSISLYWQHYLAHKQMIVADFNSSFYTGRSFSDYTEQILDHTNNLNDIHTNIIDNNKAYAVETNYIKRWKSSRLTTGASYTAHRNRSVYKSLNGETFHQRQDKVYLFAEYFQRFGNLTATAGMGVQYTDFLFKETGQGNHSWSLRPQATITYSLNNIHSFRLNLTSWQSTPSLAETNVVSQQLDGFQWRVGNQNLKTANSYMLTLRYGVNLPSFNGTFGIKAYTSPNAITPILYWDDDRLITTYENSSGLKSLSFFFAPQIEIIPDWLMASGYVQFRMQRMRGDGYVQQCNTWSGNAELALSHWGFTLSAQYVRAQRDLWGEKISWSEDMNIIDICYNLEAWQFSAGVIMPFGRYDHGSKLLSRWNCNEQHIRLDMRMPYISISYNLQWGRQKSPTRKLVEVNADADHSSAGGR